MRKRGVFQRFIRGLNFEKPSWKGRVIAPLFSGLFLFGGVAIASMWVGAFIKYAEVQSWEAADAIVTGSELEVNKDSDGDSAKILIEYDYRFRGRAYSGDRYEIGASSTNVGVPRMREIIAEYPEGRAIEIFVDPDEPEESLIKRQLAPGVWIMIPFSMPFLLVGLCGVGYGLFSGVIWKKNQALKEELIPKAPERIAVALGGDSDPDQRLMFTAMENYFQGIVLLFVSIFWNGIVSVFLIVMVQMFLSGEGEAFFLALFLIPFVLVGGFLIRTTFRALVSQRPPAWVTVSGSFSLLGESGGEPGSVLLSWMPVPDERADFRRCEIALIRMKTRKTFKKWKKKNLGWESVLVTMKKGAAGEASFEFGKSSDAHKKKWLETTYDIHLVMRWQTRDGRDGEECWQVSPTRSSDD